MTFDFSTDSALQKLFHDYPEIKADPDFAMICDTYVNSHVANGTPLAQAILDGGEQVAEKFGLGRYAKRASTEPESASEIIAQMNRQRGGL